MLYFGCQQPGWWGWWGWQADACPKADVPPLPRHPDNQGKSAFTDRGRGLHAETAQSALTVILKLIVSGLTSVILIKYN